MIRKQAVAQVAFLGRGLESGRFVGAESEDLVTQREELCVGFLKRGEVLIAIGAPATAIKDEESWLAAKFGREVELGAGDVANHHGRNSRADRKWLRGLGRGREFGARGERQDQGSEEGGQNAGGHVGLERSGARVIPASRLMLLGREIFDL